MSDRSENNGKIVGLRSVERLGGHQPEFNFQEFFENGAMALHMVGPDGIILHANQAELDLLGYQAEDYIGQHIAEFYADDSEIREVLHLLTRGEAINRYPAKLRASDGSIKHVEVTSSGKFKDGKLEYTRCFTVDVTELKRTRAELSRNEDRSRQILDSLPVAVYTTDAVGKITYYNHAAAKLAGREPQVGKDEWCVTFKLFTPEGRELAHSECPMAIALKENRPVRDVEAVGQRPDGTFFPFLPFPTPLRDADGKLTGAVNMLVDLSQQKKGERARQHLSAIIDSSFDAIVSKDLNGVIQSWNAAAERLFGYTADEAIGKHITMLIPAGKQGEEDYIISRIRNGERVESFDTVRQRKDGEPVHVSLMISPVRDDAGRIVGASKIARDVTLARESERRIRLLMREVNHRVKNQFAVINSMVRETAKRTAEPREFEKSVRERIAALARSHDLLVNSEWSGTSLFDLIQEHLKPFGHNDSVSLSGPLLMLQPNAVQYLGIAIHELATNSAKYGAFSSGHGEVSVNWRVKPVASGEKEFELSWEERYLPAQSTAEMRGGFGTAVLQRVTAQAINGTAILDREPGLVRWVLTAPMEALSIPHVSEISGVEIES
jgi:PAS domain S-box-containing protein